VCVCVCVCVHVCVFVCVCVSVCVNHLCMYVNGCTVHRPIFGCECGYVDGDVRMYVWIVFFGRMYIIYVSRLYVCMYVYSKPPVCR